MAAITGAQTGECGLGCNSRRVKAGLSPSPSPFSSTGQNIGVAPLKGMDY